MAFASNRQEQNSGTSSAAAIEATAVFVVSTSYGADQVFSCREDADRYADGRPGASVTRHVLRRSFGEAVVVFDRRVIVVDGAKRSDVTHSIVQFVDDPFLMTGPADVESFYGEDDQWHIVGFGTDEHALNTKVATAVEGARRLSRSPSVLHPHR